VGATVTTARPALLERVGFPLPSGPLSASTTPAVMVGTPIAHPVDLVQVLMRRGGGPPLVIRALRDAPSAGDPTQWFRAQLPALEPDREAEYRVEWLRAGRRIATLPTDGSWYRLLGVAEAPSPQSVTPPAASHGDWPSQPRFDYGLEFFAALTVNLRPEPIGVTPEGYRVNFYVTDGRVIGPGINAVVLPSGGDWMCIRPDGVGAVNIKITYRTDDGALILEQAGGIFDTGAEGYGLVVAGTLQGAPQFYATPTWSTAHPAWTWLNRKQGVGFGRVEMAKLQVQCDIYLPTVQV
jgi:Protein of unknown function (DUF3237)